MPILAAYLILLVHVIDTSITNVVLVPITTDLMIDAYDGHWMISAFGVGMAGVIPFVPKLVEWLGDAAALSAVLALSILSIALCGAADSLCILVVSRFLQGVSSGAVVLLMQKLMMKYVGPERRAFGLALWGSAISLAPVLGPFIGAVTIGYFNWRWLFFGQLPILVLAAMVIKDEFSIRIANRGRHLRPAPVLLFCGAMLSLEAGLDELISIDPAGMDKAAFLLSAVVLLLGVLQVMLKRANASLFNWWLLRDRVYRCYTGNAATLGAVSVGTSLVYTLWLQMQLDLAILDVAKVLSSGGLLAGTLSLAIGRMKRKDLFPWFIGAGLVSLMMSYLLCTRLNASASMFDLVLPRVLAGLGTGLCSPSGFMAVSGLDASKVLPANSLGMFIRTMFSTLLLVLSSGAARQLEMFFSQTSLANGFGTPLDGAASAASAQATHGLLLRMSGTDAMHAIFWCAVVAMAGLLLGLLKHNLSRFLAEPNSIATP